MTAVALLAQALARGLELTPDGNRIRYRGPRGALTPELRAALQACKPDLLALLTGWPRPDALAQFSHCERVRPDVVVTPADKAALVERCASLPSDRAVDDYLRDLFHHWRATAKPSLALFLARTTPRARA